MIEREKAQRKARRAENKGGKKALIAVIAVILVLLIGGGSAGFFLWSNGRKELLGGDVNLNADSINSAFGNSQYKPVLSGFGERIEYKGKIYNLNKDIVSVALLGIDKTELGLENEAVGTGGQSDVIVVGAYDTKKSEVKFLVIPRDVMIDINLYDVEGKYIGVMNSQICLSYAYGDGKEKSCQNVIDSISRLLFEMPVRYYASMDLDGISSINDAVGGVTVTSLETIASFEKGKTYTLWGDQAESYVRSRNTKLLDSDSFRRDRQRQYFEAFSAKAVSTAKKDFGFVTRLYKETSNYSVTNISLENVLYLATTLIGKNTSFNDFVTVPGEYIKGETYAEYVVDYAALFETVLSIYYVEE